MTTPNPPYTAESIQSQLSTLILVKHIDLYPQVNSTNDLAREAGRKGAQEGLVILTEEQVRGRGRLGRTWTAPPGSSILCSVLLRPRFSPQQAFYLTIAASLAILRGIKSYSATLGDASLQPRIKWPNDVFLNGRKVSGVLCESEFTGGEWAFAVVGFGINVNLSREDFGELSERATSVSAELGQEVDRAVLLAHILEGLEALYLPMQNGQFSSIYDEWAAALETVGRQVTVDYGNEQITGQAVRVERDGSLVIKTAAGVERSVLAGDIT